MIRDSVSFTAQGVDDTAGVDCVPVDDGGDDQVERGSLGAGAGGLAFSAFGWIGTCAFGLLSALLALAIAASTPSSPKSNC